MTEEQLREVEGRLARLSDPNTNFSPEEVGRLLSGLLADAPALLAEVRHLQLMLREALDSSEAYQLGRRVGAEEEREACATVAESWFDVYNIGNCIAGRIRARGADQQPSQ